MKNIIKVMMVLMVFAISTTSCKKEAEHIQDQLDYDLTVTNTNATDDYQLYLSATSSHEGYKLIGLIKAGDKRVIKSLAIHAKYFIGTTAVVGEGVHDVVKKAEVTHGRGSSDYTVDIQ